MLATQLPPLAITLQVKYDRQSRKAHDFGSVLRSNVMFNLLGPAWSTFGPSKWP